MKYFIIDIESVGLKCGFHEITEISVLNCKTLEQITWMVKIKHPERASKEALYITNKTIEELLSRGRYIEEVLDEVSEFLLADNTENDEIVMIAHNASFDRRFIEDAFVSNKKQFPGHYWLCTKEMSKKYTKNYMGIEKTSHALNDLVKLMKIKNTESENLHSSDVDVRNTWRMYSLMLKHGMSNSEFIKMSPAYMVDKPIVKVSKKKGKKQEYTLEDIMEEQSNPFDLLEEDD